MTNEQSMIAQLEDQLEVAEYELKEAQARIKELEQEYRELEDQCDESQEEQETHNALLEELRSHAARYRESFTFPDIGRETELRAILELIEGAE